MYAGWRGEAMGEWEVGLNSRTEEQPNYERGPSVAMVAMEGKRGSGGPASTIESMPQAPHFVIRSSAVQMFGCSLHLPWPPVPFRTLLAMGLMIDWGRAAG